VQFRTSSIEIDGETIRLRELSGLAVEHVQSIDADIVQGMALIALSLCNADGTPRYQVDTLADGLNYLRELPQRVLRLLTAEVEALNDAGMDDARKN